MLRFLVGLCGVTLWMTPLVDGAEPVSFREDLAPLLLKQCVGCHGPKQSEGGLRVDSYARMTQEGDSGAVGLVPGDPELSEIVRRIASDDPFERMPLDAEPLSPEQIAMFERWVDQGAKLEGEDPEASLAAIVPPPSHPKPPENYPRTVPITAIVFSADGEELIVGGYHELTVWDPSSGALLRRIENIGQRTRALALSPDGQWLAAGGGAPGRLGETRLLRMPEGEVIRRVGTTTDQVLDVAFSPQGDRIAVGAADGVIRVFAIPGGSEQLQLTSHSDFVLDVTWSADGSKLASSSHDETAKVFDAATGEVLATYSGHAGSVTAVAFHPDGEDVFSAAANQIHRWRISDAGKVSEVAVGGEVLEWTIQTDRMFAASTDKAIHVFESKNAKKMHSLTGHQDWVTSVTYHPGTKQLVSGGFNGVVKVWNADAPEQVGSFVAVPGHEESGGTE